MLVGAREAHSCTLAVCANASPVTVANSAPSGLKVTESTCATAVTPGGRGSCKVATTDRQGLCSCLSGPLPPCLSSLTAPSRAPQATRVPHAETLRVVIFRSLTASSSHTRTPSVARCAYRPVPLAHSSSPAAPPRPLPSSAAAPENRTARTWSWNARRYSSPPSSQSHSPTVPSQLPLASHGRAGWNASAEMPWRCPCRARSSVPELTSHTRISDHCNALGGPSHVAITLPPGANSTHATDDAWRWAPEGAAALFFWSSALRCAVARSQSITLQSELALTIALPASLNATDVTPFVCPSITCSSFSSTVHAGAAAFPSDAFPCAAPSTMRSSTWAARDSHATLSLGSSTLR
eukprot:1963821-Rhodomonas_salina.2